MFRFILKKDVAVFPSPIRSIRDDPRIVASDMKRALPT